MTLVVQLILGPAAIASEPSNQTWMLRPLSNLIEKRIQSAYSKALEAGWSFQASEDGLPIASLEQLRERLGSQNDFYIVSPEIAGGKKARFRASLIGASPRAIHVSFTSQDRGTRADFSLDAASILSYRSTAKMIQDQLRQYAEEWAEQNLDAKSRHRATRTAHSSDFLSLLVPVAHASSEPARVSTATVLRISSGLEICSALIVLYAAMHVLNNGFASGLLLIGGSLAISGFLILFPPKAQFDED